MLFLKLTKKFSGLTMLLIISCFIFTPFNFAHAVQIIPGCALSGNGGVCCAVLLITNLTKVIMGVAGIGALIFFIYGGFLWITSAGSPDKVKQGIKIISSTVIGLIVMVFSWTIINFTITSLVNVPNSDNTTYIWSGANDNWYSMCKKYDACGSMGSEWKCTSASSCGLTDYTQCDEALNCERGLCSEGDNQVCCNKDMDTGLKNKE
jgi:hypothetical protein